MFNLIQESTSDTSNFKPFEKIISNDFSGTEEFFDRKFEIVNDYVLMNIDLVALIGEGGFGKVKKVSIYFFNFFINDFIKNRYILLN